MISDPGETDLLVTAPSGRQTGFLEDGSFVGDIPLSFYFDLGNQPTVFIATPEAGTYKTDVRGRTAGDYELVSALISAGEVVVEQTFFGTINQRETVPYSAVLDIQSGVLETTLVPEPSSIVMALIGLLGLIGFHRRRLASVWSRDTGS